MIGYTQETLTHFLCNECYKWFSISEYVPGKNKSISCSRCGHNAIPLKMKTNNDET